MINRLKALRLYLKNSERELWYRESTKQWVLTSHVRLPTILNMECRYPSKIKQLTYAYLVAGIPWEMGEIIHAVKYDKKLKSENIQNA